MTTISVIVATYEWPEALDAVLFALSEQSDPDFEVVVADDGSGPETTATVERWRDTFGERLRHVRQDDAGYRLARVKNLGVGAAGGDFLAMIDGDSVPRRGFVEAIRKSALPGWFLGGKRLELSASSASACLRSACPYTAGR